MKIVTGYRGEPHITSAQDRAWHQGVFGTGSYVMNIGQKLRGEIVNANEIRIHDGAISHQGCIAVIAQGTYDTLDILNGEQGKKRIDLVVARYSVDSESGEEDLSLVVIEGTATAGEPSAPSFNSGDIQAGDSPVDMPIARLHINGISLESIESVATTIGTRIDTNNRINTINNNKVAKAGDTMTGQLNVVFSGHPWVKVERTGGASVQLDSASTTMNHGLWSNTLSKWLIHGNGTDVYVAGMKFTDADTACGSLGAVKKSGDTMTGMLENTNSVFRCSRGTSSVDLSSASTTANHGVYSNTQSRWLVHGDGTDVYVAGIKCTNAATLRSSISAVPTSRTVNGKALSADVTLAASDVGAAPTSHASSATTYGIGTTANYGHCKTVNGLTQASHANGLALSAYQGKVLNDKITELDTKTTFTDTDTGQISLGTVSAGASVSGTHTISTSALPATKKAIAIAAWWLSRDGFIPLQLEIVDGNKIKYKIQNTRSSAIDVSLSLHLLTVPR